MTADRLTVPEVLPLVQAYCRMEGNAVGGALHIVIEDLNIEDDHVRWCYRDALQRNDWLGATLALLLLQMTKTQRIKIAHRYSDEDPDAQAREILHRVMEDS